MNNTRIISLVFLVLSIVLAGFLGYDIYKSIDDEERIARVEGQIIKKLEMIRDAQVAYQAVNGQYTSDWGKLKSFVDTGQFYLTTRIEHIYTLDYGADSVFVEIDTLGTMLVKDSIFTIEKYPGFDLLSLDVVPGTDDTKFNMWAEKIDKSGVKVDVVEVWNPSPVDPRRKEENEARNRKPLRFGSRTSVTTNGNWE